jgi:hypothetical protein
MNATGYAKYYDMYELIILHDEMAVLMLPMRNATWWLFRAMTSKDREQHFLKSSLLLQDYYITYNMKGEVVTL